MRELKKEKCVACRKDAPLICSADLSELQPQVPQWQILSHDGIQRLQRIFRFRNFAEALAFTNSVGELAENENHHPAILTEWGMVTVTWWTHAIKGLHRNDFIMAAKTDELFDKPSSAPG
jgi:4a-hydroxytetrahydrobiopterin dehydratase